VASDVVSASFYNATTGEHYDIYCGLKQATCEAVAGPPPIPKTVQFIERVKEKALVLYRMLRPCAELRLGAAS
jgi:hypothetical protein